MDGLLAIGLAAGIGRLSWSLVEYTIHGILSHRFRTFVSPLHWSHHRTPAAVFTSPLAWVPAAAAIFALSVAILGGALGAAFVLGLLAGFLHYEHVHWRIHFRVPRSTRQERLRAHHLAHHFVNPKAYHGVTTRFWDHVFRTLPRGWESDYARGAARPPIPDPSNLRASWSPVATAHAVRQAFQRSAEGS
jgi:hypothetical protein